MGVEQKMMTKDLTLKDFKDFITECDRVFENIQFQLDYFEYLKIYGDKESMLNQLFKFEERRSNVNNIYGAYLSFNFQVEKTELYSFNQINLRIMFDNFIEFKKLEDVKRSDIYIDYCSTDEYAFNFELMIWIEEG